MQPTGYKGQEPGSAGFHEDCLIRVVRYMNPSFSKVSCIGVFSAIPPPPDFRFVLDTTDVTCNMKVVQIAGYLGSGKTTLIIAVGRILSAEGVRVAILVNEIGEIPVDGKVIQDYGLQVKDIGGGCICCQVLGNLNRTLKLLSEGPNPDIVIIEPTGMAVPNSIMETVKLLKYDAGPTIVLFDTTRSEKLLSYATLKRLVCTQLKDADIIALSKVDKVPAEIIEGVQNAVSTIKPAAEIIRLSAHRGEGVSRIVKAIKEDNHKPG